MPLFHSTLLICCKILSHTLFALNFDGFDDQVNLGQIIGENRARAPDLATHPKWFFCRKEGACRELAGVADLATHSKVIFLQKRRSLQGLAGVCRGWQTTKMARQENRVHLAAAAAAVILTKHSWPKQLVYSLTLHFCHFCQMSHLLYNTGLGPFLENGDRWQIHQTAFLSVPEHIQFHSYPS